MSQALPAVNAPDSIRARLEFVAAGRDWTKWLRAAGLSNGAIGRIPQGLLPKAEKLRYLLESEGLSLDWLLHGKDTPFSVYEIADAETAADLFIRVIERAGRDRCALYLAATPNPRSHYCIALWPVQPDEDLPSYLCSHVIRTFDLAPAERELTEQGLSFERLAFTEEVDRQLAHGLVGPYLLGKPDGVLASATRVSSFSAVAEVRMPPSPRAELARHLARLDDGQIAALLHIVRSMR